VVPPSTDRYDWCRELGYAPGDVLGERTDPVAVVIRDSTHAAAPDPDRDDPITDEELTALALAADPDAPLDPDAVPLSAYLAQLPGLLPGWYMPPAMASSGNRWRTPVIVAIILVFLLTEAWGLCSTYGQVVLA
jgi:hypothetical protein